MTGMSIANLLTAHPVAAVGAVFLGGVLTSNLLALFGFMMLEIIPVPVPHRLLERAASLEGGGRIASVFGMGAASGLVAAPCGAPPYPRPGRS